MPRNHYLPNDDGGGIEPPILTGNTNRGPYIPYNPHGMFTPVGPSPNLGPTVEIPTAPRIGPVTGNVSGGAWAGAGGGIGGRGGYGGAGRGPNGATFYGTFHNGIQTRLPTWFGRSNGITAGPTPWFDTNTGAALGTGFMGRSNGLTAGPTQWYDYNTGAALGTGPGGSGGDTAGSGSRAPGVYIVSGGGMTGYSSGLQRFIDRHASS